MNKIIMLRFGELFLKGNNRTEFEKKLFKNIKHKISCFENVTIVKSANRIFVQGFNEENENQLITVLSHVFGIVSLSVATEIETSVDNIKEYIRKLSLKGKTFRVSVKRADKTFPFNSDKFASILGGIILSNNKISVDLHNPETEIVVEIRENGKTYIFDNKIPCVGGMPLGTSGKGLLLLSGGIDSPVAGYMMAKRGMALSALHFHSYPYTSLQAKEKVIKLKELMEEYTGKVKLYVCSFTKIQEEIHRHCAPEFMITIMRRIMMRIAEKICLNNKLQTIITGESLAQVASQTIESITSTNSVVEQLPILRPLIGMDKQEIIKISENINTYETSILPYEDCCTVFLPKNPVIHPKLKDVISEESKLNIDYLIEDALNSLEVID